MLFFLVTLFSFLLFLTKPFSLRLPSWVNELSLLSVLLCQELLSHSIEWLKNYKLVSIQILKFSSTIFITKNNRSRIENVKKEEEEESVDAEMNILDLPELALDLILDKLSPNGLLNMASVCTSLRDKCSSDHFWERHFKEKWERVIGKIWWREWEIYFNSLKKRCKENGIARQNRISESILSVWPCSWFASREETSREITKSHLQVDSVMALYLALESGRFWFPAQVYNRENGHVGFLLSCYDAKLSYDSHSNTFHARYTSHGQRGTNVEENVQWNRLRAPPVDTPSRDLHISDCLNDLRPGDHIEIQWRRNKEFSYGWWYGVVGHLDSCDRDERHCGCYNCDTVILEFNQYSDGSRWRRAVVDRKDHREEGNDSDGFYGGIRKLYNKNEIDAWRMLWPTDMLG